MSVSVESTDHDFDLNIAPIIDCFTVLIAYLLVSASFVSIGFFDVGAATSSEVAAPSSAPQEAISIGVGALNAFEIKLSGPETSTVRVPALGSGARDVAGLVAAVRNVKSRWPALTDASVTADSKVEYREIIPVVESLKKEFTKVFVGE